MAGIKKSIFKFAGYVFSAFRYKYILFESKPDFSDNTLYVYNEMLKRGYDTKYKMVWVCSDLKENIVHKDKCICINMNNKILRFYYSLRAKYLISCNCFLPKFHNKQLSLYLTHGFGIKKCGGYQAPEGIDYTAGLSDIANKINSDDTKFPYEQYVVTGYPRNDELVVNKQNNCRGLFGNHYKKIVVWYPTFRQHALSNIKSATANALPIINDEQSAVILNSVAAEKGILIVLKPHFSQDTSFIKDKSLSNILIIDNSFFERNNITSYEFVASCDAMITDYSSIYFDYLLCDKPTAAIWEDIDEYRNNRGFALDVDYYMKGAYKIYNLKDYIDFIKEVSNDYDSLAKERSEIKSVIHAYPDGHSAERVVDFIESKKLR